MKLTGTRSHAAACSVGEVIPHKTKRMPDYQQGSVAMPRLVTLPAWVCCLAASVCKRVRQEGGWPGVLIVQQGHVAHVSWACFLLPKL